MRDIFENPVLEERLQVLTDFYEQAMYQLEQQKETIQLYEKLVSLLKSSK